MKRNLRTTLALTESLETRALLTTSVDLVGGALTITDVDGDDSNESLQLSYSGGTYTLTDIGGLAITTGIAGSTGSGSSSVTIPDSGVTGIEFDLLGGDDAITVASVQASLSDGFQVKAGTGLDQVTINGPISASGTGAIDISTSQSISVSADLNTVDGNITLDADTGAQVAGDFEGVTVSGVSVTTSGGNVHIEGRGGDDSSGAQSQTGVQIEIGSVVSAGGMGTVVVSGVGGNSTASGNYGVAVANAGSMITSAGGDVLVTGQGGGTATDNHGVFVLDEGRITAGGAGTVTVMGVGSTTGTNQNFGVHVSGPNSTITSTSGAVSVTGIGGGPASGGNAGVVVSGAGTITAGGVGTTTVEGIGGTTGGGVNYGVWVTGAGSRTPPPAETCRSAGKAEAPEAPEPPRSIMESSSISQVRSQAKRTPR